MPDPFSIGTGTFAVVCTALKICMAIYELCGDIRNAPRHLLETQAIIESCSAVLQTLQTLSHHSQSNPDQDNDEDIRIPIEGMEKLLRELRRRLPVLSPAEERKRKLAMMSRIRLKLCKKDVEGLLQQLNHHQVSASIALGSRTHRRIQTSYSDLQEIKDSLRQLNERNMSRDIEQWMRSVNKERLLRYASKFKERPERVQRRDGEVLVDEFKKLEDCCQSVRSVTSLVKLKSISSKNSLLSASTRVVSPAPDGGSHSIDGILASFAGPQHTPEGFEGSSHQWQSPVAQAPGTLDTNIRNSTPVDAFPSSRPTSRRDVSQSQLRSSTVDLPRPYQYIPNTQGTRTVKKSGRSRRHSTSDASAVPPSAIPPRPLSNSRTAWSRLDGPGEQRRRTDGPEQDREAEKVRAPVNENSRHLRDSLQPRRMSMPADRPANQVQGLQDMLLSEPPHLSSANERSVTQAAAASPSNGFLPDSETANISRNVPGDLLHPAVQPRSVYEDEYSDSEEDGNHLSSRKSRNRRALEALEAEAKQRHKNLPRRAAPVAAVQPGQTQPVRVEFLRDDHGRTVAIPLDHARALRDIRSDSTSLDQTRATMFSRNRARAYIDGALDLMDDEQLLRQFHAIRSLGSVPRGQREFVEQPPSIPALPPFPETSIARPLRANAPMPGTFRVARDHVERPAQPQASSTYVAGYENPGSEYLQPRSTNMPVHARGTQFSAPIRNSARDTYSRYIHDENRPYPSVLARKGPQPNLRDGTRSALKAVPPARKIAKYR